MSDLCSNMNRFHDVVVRVLENTVHSTPKQLAHAICGDLTDVEFALLDLVTFQKATIVSEELQLFKAIKETCETDLQKKRPHRRPGLLLRQPAGKTHKKRKQPPTQK